MPHHSTKFPDPSSNWMRVSEAEKKERERFLNIDLYDKVRQASEVHRQVCILIIILIIIDDLVDSVP